MKVKAFYRPETIDDALALLNTVPGAKLIAGGTDLAIALNERQVSPEALIDLSGIVEMRRIWEEGKTLHIGACATFSDLQFSQMVNKFCPSLCEAALTMGSTQIRNLATIGGNVANAATAADGIPPLLSVDAIAVVKSSTASREVPLSDVITGSNRNSLAENEMITEFLIAEHPGSMMAFEKIGRRKALAISRINLSVCADLKGQLVKSISIIVGAVGKTAYRVTEVENFLINKDLTEAVILMAADMMDETVARNLAGRSTTPYKRKIAGAVLKRSLERVSGGCNK